QGTEQTPTQAAANEKQNLQPADAHKPVAPTREIVVAVDAGHGGSDPGAIGPRGTQEKDVVLRVAQRLASMIDEQPGMRAIMTRKGDYYVGLRERMMVA